MQPLTIVLIAVCTILMAANATLAVAQGRAGWAAVFAFMTGTQLTLVVLSLLMRMSCA